MSNVNGGDFGDLDLDPEERLDADLAMDDPGDTDNVAWTPPDHEPQGLGDGDGSISEELWEEEPEDSAPADDLADEEPELAEELGDGPETGAMHLE